MRRTPYLPALLILLCAGWAFAPAIHGGWIWDDDLYVTANPMLRHAAGLWAIWFAPTGVNHFPITSTVEWVQWHLWQNDPAGYHLCNIALHVLSAFLVWRLLGKLGVRLAWLGGLLFAVHPLVTESVVWVAELKNVLSLPLLLLAACAYIDWEAQGGRRRYVRSLLWFLAAMLSKSTVAMFPLMLPLYAWWRRRPIRLKPALPFLAVSLCLGAVTVWFEHHRAIDSDVVPDYSVASRIAGSGAAVAFYLGKCVWPTGLLPMYPSWQMSAPSPAQFLPWLAVGALIVWLWTKRETWGRPGLLGLGWMLINLAPVLGLVRMSYQRIAWVADHFAYVPLIGAVGLVAAGASSAVARLTASARNRALAAGLAVAVILACCCQRYAGQFRDHETLWTYTLRQNPNAWLAENDLAFALQEKGQLEAAIGHYRQALRLNPGSALANYSLGNTLARSGRIPEAIACYEKAVQLRPGYAEAHDNLGNALFRVGRGDEAIAQFETAIRLKPDYAAAQNNLGTTLAQLGRVPEAIQHLEIALRLSPDSAQIRGNLAKARSLVGARVGQ